MSVPNSRQVIKPKETTTCSEPKSIIISGNVQFKVRQVWIERKAGRDLGGGQDVSFVAGIIRWRYLPSAEP